jgi:hypothetical protein
MAGGKIMSDQKTKTMWKLCFDRISEHEITRESNSSVWFKTSHGNECRELRLTTYYQWFNTKEQAKLTLLKRKQSDLEYHGTMIVRLRDEIKKIEAL